MKNLFMKIVSIAVVITMIASMGIMVRAYEYPDEGYWANEAIDAAIANGLLRGKEDGKIHSEDNLTRAEMAAIMVRSFGATVKADVSNYVDLEQSAWYYDEFSKAVQMRVFEGDGSGHMRPNDPITREEVFTVVARALVLSDSDYSVLNKFHDADEISSWAKGYMSILTQKSYVNGDNLGNVNPKKNITRAEFAQLMHNIFRNYYSKADTYTGNTDSHSSMINTGNVTFKNVTINNDLVIGDGDATGTIRLENVNIKGRLLVRGCNRVELVKTTVGEMVVVNNYNTIVHFDNYRDEAVFDDIILNTQATFKEKAVAPTPGGSGGGGGGGGGTTTTIGYKVEYYIQSTDLKSYSKHSSTSTIKATAGTKVTAEIKEIEGFTYDPDNDKNVLTGTVPSKGTVTLKVYYNRNSYDYTVKYYQQNVDDLTKYDEVTADSYTKKALFDVEVTADEKTYTGFKVNTSKTKDSGKVTADGKLLLEVYYDIETYIVTYDEDGGSTVANGTAYYGKDFVLPGSDSTTKAGYYLKGWNVNGTEYAPGATVTGITADITAKAVWGKLSPDDAEYVTVTFYDMGYEVASVDVERNTTMAESQFPDYGFDYKGYVKDSNVSAVYAESYTHVISYGWWYNPEAEKWEEFTTETVVESDMDVHLKTNKFSAIVTLADGMAFNFYTYFETDTRFADTVKDILYKGAPLTALKTSGYWDKVRENGKVQKLLDEEDNIMMLSYMIKFSQILGEENVEKFIVDNAKEMFASGNNELLHDAFVEYIISVANSDNPDEKKKVHDLMESTINHIFEEEEISTETLDIIRDLCDEVLSDPETFKEVTGYELADLPTDTKTFVIDYIIIQLTENDDMFEQLVETIIGVDYTETTTTKDLIIAMAEKQLNDSFDSTIDSIKDSQKDLIVETVDSMLSDSSNGLYDEVLTYAVENEKDTIVNTIKTLLETEDSLYDEVMAIVADDATYRAMVAEAVGTKLLTDDVLFEALTGYNPAMVSDRAAAVNTLKDEITNDKSSFETTIEKAENAGNKTFIIESIVSELETNKTFFNTVLAEAQVDYRDTMVDVMVDKLEEPNSPMYAKVIELAKTPAYKQTIKDAIIDEMKGVDGNRVISAITGATDEELAKDPQDKDGFIMNKVEEQLNDGDYLDSLVEEVTGVENYTLPATPKEFIIDMVIAELANTDSTSGTRDMIIEEAIAYLLEAKDEDEIGHIADYAIDYLGNHPDERDALVDEIINDVYKDEVDKLVYQLINEEQFEVHADTVFVAEGLKSVLLEDYNYETFFGSKIPERLEKAFEIYPEEKIIELYEFALNDLIGQIDTAIDTAVAGGVGYIDSGITPVVNIISDVYVPLHDNLTRILEDKAGDKYYYSENIYLQELVKLLDPEVWVTGSENYKPSDTSGYKIYDLDYYYDLMYKIVVLGDDAILWYYNNLSEEEYVELTNNYQSLVLKYVNIIVDNVNAYVTDGTLPHEKLTAVEKAIMEKYPELVNKIIDKYTNSEYFGKEATADDYQKIRDKMYELFHNVNLTTNEYFDKILNHEAIEDLENKVEDKLDGKLDGEYYTKIDDNTYEFEANDYKVRFERELTDA